MAAAAISATSLLLAACGTSSSSAPSSSTSSPSSSAASTSTAAAAGKFLGCLVTDTGGINDKSFNQSSWQAMQEAAAANPNISVKYLQSTSQSDYVPNINSFIAEKCGIIVTNGFLMGAATQTAAQKNPSQHFAIVDFSYSPAIPNVDALVFNTVQDGYLGGYLAAGMSKTGKVATFGGMKLPTVTIYMDGFYDGVQAYNAKHHTNVQVLGWNESSQNGSFTGDFTNQTKGQTTTQTFISEGADVIFPVAGNVGLGAAKAVQTADNAGGHVRTRRAVLQVLHLQRDEGRCGRGQDRGDDRRGRLVQGRQLHRHASQWLVEPGAVPRLRVQGAGLAAGRAEDHPDRNRERDDQARHQEPGQLTGTWRNNRGT
jgi:basic membrane lipoprotein Med (substrate-binding protein (PBP1-ABC) superfamily)